MTWNTFSFTGKDDEAVQKFSASILLKVTFNYGMSRDPVFPKQACHSRELVFLSIDARTHFSPVNL